MILPESLSISDLHELDGMNASFASNAVEAEVEQEDDLQEVQPSAAASVIASTVSSHPSSSNNNHHHTRTSVIVIGAGMSGLACARELQHRNYKVLVVEARQRVGGRLNGSSIRIKPQHASSEGDLHAHTDVDLGGALIHGTLENPVALLLEEMGIAVQPVSDCLLLNSSGWPVDPREDDRVSALFNECLDIAFARITEQGDNESHRLSFGKMFRAVCDEKNVSPSTLLQWHQANLEVSCGASFDRLGYKWNDDEQYGFDGDHVAVQKSWKAVMDSLAEPLDILYDAPVKHIHVVHPPLETTEIAPTSNNATPLRTTSNGARQAHQNLHRNTLQRSNIKSSITTQPSRLSHRIRGVAAGARRSTRSKLAVDRYTINAATEPPQRGSGNSKKEKGVKETMVRVTLENGTVLEAHAVVCTLPLGILKSSSITFDPPLPLAKQHAIQRLGNGLLNKCILSFSRVFWQDSDFLGLAANDRAYLVLNGHKYTGQPILIFMYGGDFARDIQEWTDKEIVDDCLHRLKTMCGNNVAPVVDYRVTRWGKEQYSLMSFSYVPPGIDGPMEYRAMSDPIMDHTGSVPVLMFAGEHTTPYHPSTIHGAFLSGIREAYRLDCALFPEANDNLEFRDDDLYERTFPLVPRSNGMESDTARPPRRDSQTVSSSRTAGHRPHRRRGAATVTFVPDWDAAAVGDGAKVSRRSQRSTLIINETDDDMMQPTYLLESDTIASENEQIMRGMGSYGRDYEYLQSKVLPVHSTNTHWSISQVKKRVQSLTAAMRKTRPSTSSVWKRWIAKEDGTESASTKLTPSRRSTGSNATPKSAPASNKPSLDAVPLMRKAHLLTTTRSGRKVRTIFATPKRQNANKTRFGRSIKKPRTL
ncbi:hypothetical protein MPSEU_001046600 [Mayamaea pseudoterrestris]|nr:hypothetical protein MPSEU_001046600 [Mayamaea pseudoterrestris]